MSSPTSKTGRGAMFAVYLASIIALLPSVALGDVYVFSGGEPPNTWSTSQYKFPPYSNTSNACGTVTGGLPIDTSTTTHVLTISQHQHGGYGFLMDLTWINNYCGAPYGDGQFYGYTDEGYFFYTISGGVVTIDGADPHGVTTDPRTRILSLTYSTTTGYATISDFFNPASSTPRVDYSVSTALLGQILSNTVHATSTGYFSYSFYVPQPIATSTEGFNEYTISTDIYSDETCTGSPFFGTLTCTDPRAPYLDSTSTTATLGVTANVLPVDLIATSTCGITSLDGCLRNAFLWAFYINPSVTTQFDGIKEQIAHKPPIAYINIVRNSISNLTATGTAAFTFSPLPDEIRYGIFAPVTLGLGFVIQLYYLSHLYARMKHIQV